MQSRLRRIDVLYANRTKIARKLRKGSMKGDGLAVGRGDDRHPPPTVSCIVTGETLNYVGFIEAFDAPSEGKSVFIKR